MRQRPINTEFSQLLHVPEVNFCPEARDIGIGNNRGRAPDPEAQDVISRLYAAPVECGRSIGRARGLGAEDGAQLQIAAMAGVRARVDAAVGGIHNGAFAFFAIATTAQYNRHNLLKIKANDRVLADSHDAEPAECAARG